MAESPMSRFPASRFTSLQTSKNVAKRRRFELQTAEIARNSSKKPRQRPSRHAPAPPPPPRAGGGRSLALAAPHLGSPGWPNEATPATKTPRRCTFSLVPSFFDVFLHLFEVFRGVRLDFDSIRLAFNKASVGLSLHLGALMALPCRAPADLL